MNFKRFKKKCPKCKGAGWIDYPRIWCLYCDGAGTLFYKIKKEE
tara:strand:+ start:587 stop:718 length:132 start_codon:yes stop_codon:yes gene_type:complete